MPDLLERFYCSEQIHIPPTFPNIMKVYCKAAIRTQPYDLLRWSAAYFRALANGEEPPVKERIEYPPYDSPSGLTPGYIKILINQFGKDPLTTVSAQTLFKKWSDICLEEILLIKLIALLGAPTTVNWVQFAGVCAGFISKSLTHTMILVCELFTEEPEGGMSTVPYDLFIDLYMFLAQMDCGPLTQREQESVKAVTAREDICRVTDKIKEGIYEGEVEGEVLYIEDLGEGGIPYGEEGETNAELSSSSKEVTERRFQAEETEREGMGSVEEAFEEKGEEEAGEKEAKGEEGEAAYSDKSSFREGEASFETSGSTLGEEFPLTIFEGESEKKDMKRSMEEKRVSDDMLADEDEIAKTYNLDEIEGTIREKIEARLGADISLQEEKEFEGLTSYLLRTATKVRKYGAANIGFQLFKKYSRQDLPGIGPVISPEQVEKVVNFMDAWAHKQEHMVMPRNIRHWMCPPLDKLPFPEP